MENGRQKSATSNSHRSKRNFTCYICCEKFESLPELSEHKDTHKDALSSDEQDEYQVDFKDSMISIKEDRLEVAKTLLRDACLQCDVSHEQFRSMYDLKYHPQSFCKYSCNKCNINFRMKNRFFVHIAECHMYSKFFNCAYCVKSCNDFSSLQLHLVSKHGTGGEGIEPETYFSSFLENAQIFCDVCCDVFTSYRLFEQHMVAHDQDTNGHDATDDDDDVIPIVDVPCTITISDDEEETGKETLEIASNVSSVSNTSIAKTDHLPSVPDVTTVIRVVQGNDNSDHATRMCRILKKPYKPLIKIRPKPSQTASSGTQSAPDDKVYPNILKKSGARKVTNSTSLLKKSPPKVPKGPITGVLLKPPGFQNAFEKHVTTIVSDRSLLKHYLSTDSSEQPQSNTATSVVPGPSQSCTKTSVSSKQVQRPVSPQRRIRGKSSKKSSKRPQWKFIMDRPGSKSTNTGFRKIAASGSASANGTNNVPSLTPITLPNAPQSFPPGNMNFTLANNVTLPTSAGGAYANIILPNNSLAQSNSVGKQSNVNVVPASTPNVGVSQNIVLPSTTNMQLSNLQSLIVPNGTSAVPQPSNNLIYLVKSSDFTNVTPGTEQLFFLIPQVQNTQPSTTLTDDSQFLEQISQTPVVSQNFYEKNQMGNTPGNSVLLVSNVQSSQPAATLSNVQTSDNSQLMTEHPALFHSKRAGKKKGLKIKEVKLNFGV